MTNLKQIPSSIILEKSKSDKILDWFKFCIKAGFFLLVFFAISSGPNLSQEIGKPGKIISNYVGEFEQEVQKIPGQSDIAWIKVSGIIANKDFGIGQGIIASENILQMLEMAKNDQQVKIVVLDINSPGGTVLDSEKISNKIIDLKKHKKVYALMGSVAASGGYYIAANCDKIFAYDETITGSIGVILSVPNISKLSEKIGVSKINISSGKFKSMGDPFTILNDETKKILQDLVDESYDKFVNIVSSGRGLSKDKIRHLADGRIYSGKQALSLNLIDSNKGKQGLLDESFTTHGDLNIKLFNIKKSPLEEFFMPTSKIIKQIIGINGLDFNMQTMYLMN